MAAITSGSSPLQTGLLILLMFQTIPGYGDVISNSFISPNSAEEQIAQESLVADLTSAPSEIVKSSSLSSVELSESDAHYRVLRSADPIIARNSGKNEDLTFYKNVADGLDHNDVELSGRVAKFIQPSRTIKDGQLLSFMQTGQELSGEGLGAPQPRQLLEPLNSSPSATVGVNSAIPSSLHERPRQANPDIQDIITGIVKLLNGNVNVQANTAPILGRPVRPVSTRINNRGPPRITDVPALPPDFDIPSQPLPPPPLGQKPPPQPTRMPTPYPFDLPPQNTSPVRPYGAPTQIIPLNNKRPGFYRPVTIPPWSRPPHRRPIPPHRRPTPIPPYKPLSNAEDVISITSEKPMEDILTLDLGSDMMPSFDEAVDNNSYKNDSTPSPPEITTVKDDDKEFERNKEKSTSKMEKYTTTRQENHYTPTPEPLDQSTPPNTENESDIDSTTIQPTETTTEIIPTPPVNISMETLNTDTNNASFQGVSNPTPTLEASIEDAISTIRGDLIGSTSISSTATEALPSILPSTSSSTSTTSSSLSTVEQIHTTAAKEITGINNTTSANPNTSQGFPYYPYRPRPGIVLDDTEYKPGGVKRPPIVTARPPLGQLGEIFDITVSAIQGPGGVSSNQGKPYVIPVDIENVHLGINDDVITSPVGDEGFVSIDGKRTYLNLFGDPTQNPSMASSVQPTKVGPTGNVIKATGYAIPEVEKAKPDNINGLKPTPRRPLYGKRPHQPPVRIDTCIVGDDSTCDATQYEVCRTEAGVSACHCRPGHARRKHRDPCRRVVSVLLSLRVDRLYERRVVWSNEFVNKGSESYQQLSYEAERAVESAMSMTPFSDEFLGAKVNSVYRGERSAGQAGVFVNVTLQLEENSETARPTVRGDIQRHLLGVIQRRSNNIGNSALWVDSPPGSVSNLQDVDECSSPELHDCHSLAKCINTFGGFKCECAQGYRDPWPDNKFRAGRQCDQCSPQHCNNRGECKYDNGQEVCICTGNYYGAQCELDGEVLGVAIGASVAAVIIIGLTLVCLVMWSRRWNREQKAAVGSPVFGYMATASNTVKTPVVGGPPYQLTLEDRLRWAQIADAMAQTNHYAPEPVNNATRPSSAIFGYPSLSMAGTLPHGNMHGTLPPIPLPRLNIPASFAGRAASIHGMRPLDNCSSSEEEDKVDLLGRSFQVPRPKSRSNASIANQSGIYYDVDYDQNEIYKHPSGTIPMSTYTAGRHPFYRN